MKKYLVAIPNWTFIASIIYGANKKDAINKFKQKHKLLQMPKLIVMKLS